MINYLRTSVVSLFGISTGTIRIRGTGKTKTRELSLRPISGRTAALLVGIRGEPMKGEDITRHVKRNYKDLFRAVRKDTGQKRLPPWRPRCSGTTHLDKQF